MARINFNPEQTRPYTGAIQTLPAGDYVVEIVAEKEQTLKDGQSRALVFDYQIVDGPFRGQRIHDNINLWHVNANAVSIAQSILTAIARAVGKTSFMDTLELQRIPFVVQLATRVYNGKEYNSFVEYRSAGQTPTNQPVQPQPFWNK